MKPISYFLDEILLVNGNIQVIPYDQERHQSLNSHLIWQNCRINQIQLSHYGDDSWLPENEVLSITFFDASPALKHELKALALGMTTHGSSEGMGGIKWSSTRLIIQICKRFGIWINNKGIDSLAKIDELSLLKVRNFLLDYLKENNASKTPNVGVDLLRIVYWLNRYAILKSPERVELFNEILAPYFAQKKQVRKSHSIIPTGVMRQLLAKCDQILAQATKYYDQWENIFLSVNQMICTGNIKNDSLDGILLAQDEELYAQIYPVFSELRVAVFILVLSYSGMRINEVKALEDDSAFERNGNYYLRSKLSKTTDGKQDLEWVTSQIAFEGVLFLSKINKLYRNRAELILQHHFNRLSDTKKMNLQYGVRSKGLFQVQTRKKNSTFSELNKFGLNDFLDFNHLFSFRVTELDIEQLERLNSNYQSINRNHSGFHKPYEVGMIFNFTAHQFRHTFAWFIIANRLGDLDDIKYQYKHLESAMTLVYGQRGYESINEFEALVQSFEEYLNKQVMTELVDAAQNGGLGGKGGTRFIQQLQNLLGVDLEMGATPHFTDMKSLLTYLAKHSGDFRGLPHGYCLKGSSCKVKNAADPSHCIYCDGYIATRRHLPHWRVIKEKCETQLASFERLPNEMQNRFQSFKGALTDNILAANVIINQIEQTINGASNVTGHQRAN